MLPGDQPELVPARLARMHLNTNIGTAKSWQVAEMIYGYTYSTVCRHGYIITH